MRTSIKCRVFGWWILPAVFLFGASVTLAQLPTGTILGVVRDSTGAVVPETTLTARNLDTGQARTVTSGASGDYRFSALPVGNYEIRLEHPGFRTEVRIGLTLTVGQEAVINFTMEVGAVEQTVEVTAEAPLVNTTTGSLGGLVDEQRIADLPLNGRNVLDLTLLQTGVTVHQNHSTTSGYYGVFYSSNGAPISSNNILLDGASMLSIYGGSAGSASDSTLGVEGIREYRVVTNSFSAEYGMTMGSQTMIVSKGGTNQLHGSLFEYLRNSALDARNFFDRKSIASQRRLPAFARNSFGGSLGGPIKKDKTFLFGVYEGVRERLGVTTISNVIPPSAKVDGAVVPQIAPIIKPFLALFPDPNLPNNQYTFPFSQPTTENYGQVRVDQTFTTTDTLFVRYTVDYADQTRPLDYPQFKLISRSGSQISSLSENHIFSPAALSTFRLSYSGTFFFSDSPSELTGPQYSFVPGEYFGGISITGFTGPATAGTSPLGGIQNIQTLSDDLFYTRGRHSLKFGILINRYRQYLLNSASRRGSASFPTLTNFLLAVPQQYNADSPGSIFDRTHRYNTFGFYLQDDLRASQRLTLNLGLRYEFMTQIHEVHGINAVLRDAQHDAQVTVGIPFLNPSMRNISPRFGFAWDVRGNGQTALRGGFGLLYDIGNLARAQVGTIFGSPLYTPWSTYTNPPTLTVPFFFPPEHLGKSVRFIEYHLQQPHMMQYNLTLERHLPFGMGLTVAYGGSRGLNLITNKEGNPTVPQVLPDGRQFWTGNESRTNPNWDQYFLKTAASNSWYNSLQVGLSKRLSRGLQFQSSYTWAKIIDETQSYAPADNSASNSVGADPVHRTVDRAPADFDITQNWRFNAIYRLPELSSAGGVLGKVLNGWWVSGILALQTGYPFTPTLGSNRSRNKIQGGGGGIDRPDLVLGRKNDNIILGGPDRYFDPSGFTIPAAGFLGTAGRTILRAPGLAKVDFSVVKDASLGFLGESGKLELRAEFFNILNRANFGTPARTVFSAVRDVEAPVSNVGQITSTVGSSRQIQLALKVVW